jgi:hypothetical protein
MVGRAMEDDASIADLPWASVFDPAANVRALGAIQERGFRAASEVVDRFVRLTARGFGAPRPSTAGEQSESADATADPELGRMFASIQTLVGKLGQTAMGATAPSEAALDLQNSSATGEARLHAAGAGVTVTEVWLHNRGPEDLGVLRLRCSDLLSHDGALIPSSRIRIDPDVVPMPARCSRGVTVEVDVAQEHSPGHYRGTLLADGHSDVWLPLVLNIASRSA